MRFSSDHGQNAKFNTKVPARAKAGFLARSIASSQRAFRENYFISDQTAYTRY